MYVGEADFSSNTWMYLRGEVGLSSNTWMFEREADLSSNEQICHLIPGCTYGLKVDLSSYT